MRIAFDVSPLSHPRTGVGNYIRGSLAGLAEAAGGRARDRRLRADEPAGEEGDPCGARRASRSSPLQFLPFAHFWRQGWSRLGRPPVERFLGPIDVLHFSDWMYPPQRGGIRATTIHDLVPLRFPEWVQGRTRRMHGAKYRNAARTCDVVFANSAFTARDVVELLGVPEDGCGSRCREWTPSSRATARSAELGGDYVLTVATLEPRKNLETLVEAHALLGRDDLLLAVVGAEGWGEQPALDRPGIVRLGYVDDDELARLYRGAAVFVYPSRFEGFGMPVDRGDGVRRAGRRSSHESMDEACGDAAVRADPERSGRDRRGNRDGARPAGRARPARPRARRALLVERHGPGLPRRVPGGGLMRVGLDVSPLDQTRAGTARYIEGIDALEGIELVRLGHRGSGRTRDRRPRRVVVPGRASPRLARRERLDVLHCPTFRGPFHPRRCRSSSPFTTSPSCATQRRSTGGRGATAACASLGWRGRRAA